MRVNLATRLYKNADTLVKKYGLYLKALDEEYKENKHINHFESDIERSSFAQLLENAANMAATCRKVIDEDALSSVGVSTLNAVKNIETNILDLYAGTAAQMLSYNVVAIQAIETPQAYVYYFDFKYAKDKGAISAGQSFISHLTHNTANYAGSEVFGEGLGLGSAVTTGPNTLAYTPIVPGTIVISTDDGAASAKDNGNGGFTNSVGTLFTGTPTIDYETGALVMTIDSGSSAKEILVDYQYDTEVAEPNPIQAELVAVPVTAEVKTLKSTATLAAVLNAKSVLGVDMSDISLEVATRELAAEFDYDIFRDLYKNTTQVLTVAKFTAPELYETFLYRYEEAVERASNVIFNATQKLEASFMIVGTEHANVIAQSGANKFVPADNRGNYSAGAREVGIFKGLYVIKVPDSVFDADDAIVGAKSDIPVLGCGYIFCPYIMAFPSQLISDENLRVKQGFISMAGRKMVNPNLYVKLSLV